MIWVFLQDLEAWFSFTFWLAVPGKEVERAAGVWRGGLETLSPGEELSGLLCFKTGIKQYYFVFHAEFMASGGKWETQAQKKTELAGIPLFSINKAS